MQLTMGSAGSRTNVARPKRVLFFSSRVATSLPVYGPEYYRCNPVISTQEPFLPLYRSDSGDVPHRNLHARRPLIVLELPRPLLRDLINHIPSNTRCPANRKWRNQWERLFWNGEPPSASTFCDNLKASGAPVIPAQAHPSARNRSDQRLVLLCFNF
jgi:hypothetical protein